MPSLTRPAKVRQQRVDDLRPDFELRVLGALEELLADGTPFTEIAVARIAAAAHVARSTFYRYFPDKSRLLIRMADLATEDLFDAAEEWWQADHTDARTTVVGAMQRMISGFREHRWVLVALSEVSTYDHEVGRYWRGRVGRFMGLVCARLESEQQAGHIDSSIDVMSTAVVLTSMVERSITVAFMADSPIDDERLARSLGRAIWLVVYGDAART